MYPCGKTVIELLNAGNKQSARITFYGSAGTMQLTDADLVAGTLNIDRYCLSGDKIELGSAISTELTFSLRNQDGKYDNVKFEGAELFVEIGTKDWGGPADESTNPMRWIPIGYFTIDEPPRTLSTISVVALDRMVRLDRIVDDVLFTFPMTVELMIDKICGACDLQCATNTSALTNRQYEILAFPETDEPLTYRALIQWLAEITGTCAYADWNGKLAFKWYEATDVSITPSERFSSDMKENDISITGLVFSPSEEERYLSGSDSYAIDLSGNALIQSDYQEVLDTVYAAIGPTTYRPYDATIKAAPYLFPLDRISYMDKTGNVHDTIVTNVHYTINKHTVIAAKGETLTNSGYAVSGGLTKQQSIILNQMKENINRNVSDRQQAVLDLNQTIAGALGLRVTVISEDGFDQYYYHNGVTLEESNIIYTFNAGGFAWTSDWNDGNPVWEYGITRYGNAVVNMLSAYKITADLIEAGSISADQISLEYTEKISEDIDSAVSTLESQITENEALWKSFIRLDPSVPQMEMGRTDSPVNMVLTNTQLSFVESGLIVAYISNRALHILRAEIEELFFGNDTVGRYANTIGETGTLDLDYISAEE